MWVGLNGFDAKNDLVLGSVRIGMSCMNLVTVISIDDINLGVDWKHLRVHA